MALKLEYDRMRFNRGVKGTTITAKGLEEQEIEVKRARNLAKARKVGLLKDGYAGWLIQRDWEDKRFTVQGLESALAKLKAKESEIGKLLKDPIKYRDHILAFWMDYAAELQKQVDALLEIERQVKGRKKPEKKNRKANKFNPFNVEMQELDVINARIEMQISYNNYITQLVKAASSATSPSNIDVPDSNPSE